MTVFHLFWSSDPLAAAVIAATWALFVWWAVSLGRAWRRVVREQELFNRLREVGPLADALYKRGARGTGERDDAATAFLEGRGVPLDSVAARHVRSIYEAGWSGTRLDLSELSALTIARLFGPNGWLRSVLSLFIVVGLFGTLAGLTKALAPLAGLGIGGGGPVPAAGGMGDALQELLLKLQSAFAPSVTGVLLTVLGVIAYALYVRWGCSPLRDLVDDLTIRVWIPTLYPTESQRVLNTLKEADRQAHDNLEAARRVADFADRIDKDLASLQPDLKVTRGALKGLRTSLKVADRTANKLVEATAELAPFRIELREANDRAVAQSGETAKLVASLLEQNKRLTDGVSVLRVFEDSFVEHQARVNAKSERLLESATRAIGRIEERNEEVVRAVGDPIVVRLQEMDGGLRQGLGDIRSTLGRIQEPVGESAERIERIAKSFEDQMVQHIGELKREFRAQNKKGEEDESALRELAGRVGHLASVIEASSSRQSELLELLAQKAGARRPLHRRVIERFRKRRASPSSNGRETTSA